jgi:hypothetical protein
VARGRGLARQALTGLRAGASAGSRGIHTLLRTLEAYDGTVMALLTIAVVVLGLLSFRAARDAANAAKEQVLVQTLPFVQVDVSPLGLSGVTYDDGRRLPSSHRSPIDVAVVERTIYVAVSLQDVGPGIAVIHDWRVGPADLIVKRAYYPPPVQAQRQWVLGPSRPERFALSNTTAMSQPNARALAAAVRRGRVLVQYFYSDLSGKRRIKTTLLVAKRPGARFWRVAVENFQNNWDPTPGLDTVPRS